MCLSILMLSSGPFSRRRRILQSSISILLLPIAISFLLSELSVIASNRSRIMKFVAALFLVVNSAFAFSPSSPAFKASRPSTTLLYGEYGASSTSFYTKTEKKDSYESMESVLEQKCKDPKVRQVIIDMLGVCAEITDAIRTALVTVEGSMNDFGDAQLSVDVSIFLVFTSN